MKYFSMFSGIAGFELGIQQAHEEIKVKLCEENVQNAKRINCSKNSTMERTSVAVENAHTKTSEQDIGQIPKNIKELFQSGKKETQKSTKKHIEKSTPQEEEKYLLHTEENAYVAERQHPNSLLSTTKEMMEQKKEKSMVQASICARLSKVSQKHTNSSATTATTPEERMENVLTKPKCVGYSEIDKFAIQIYTKHFPNHIPYGDCTTINVSELPDFDLLVGGFPCQSFSVAGKRGGFQDTRGTLFFNIAKVLKAKRPQNFVLENVKGLLSHDEGNTFATIISTIDELGYDCQWSVNNSKDFGVPQNRERVFIIGHLRGTRRPKVFPIGEDDKHDKSKNQIRGYHSPTITANKENIPMLDLTSPRIKQLNQPKHSNDRVYSKKGLSPTLNTMQGGNRQPFIPEGSKIRRLTPVECERLQGFPDGWTEGVSDAQRYKCLGNAVTVNVIKQLIIRIIN